MHRFMRCIHLLLGWHRIPALLQVRAVHLLLLLLLSASHSSAAAKGVQCQSGWKDLPGGDRERDAAWWLAQAQERTGGRITVERGTATSCERNYGGKYIHDWGRAKHVLCVPPAPTGGDGAAAATTSPAAAASAAAPATFGTDGVRTTSSVHCYPNPLKTSPMTFCVSRNIVVDWAAFVGGDGNRFNNSYFTPGQNSSQVACDIHPDAQAEASNYVGHFGTSHWLKHSLITGQYGRIQELCAPGSPALVEHPVLFVTRNLYNAYHNMEDAVNVFSMLAALDLDEVKGHGVQVIMADKRNFRQVLEVYRRLSHPHPLMGWDSMAQGGVKCYKLALHAPGGQRMSILQRAYHRYKFEECSSIVAQAASAWYSGLFRELHVTSPLDSASHPMMHKKISWSSRRNGELAQLATGSLAEKYRDRMLLNEDELLMALRSRIQKFNSETCDGEENGLICVNRNVTFYLRELDFSEITMADSLWEMKETAILVGMHGAGMSNQFFMPPGRGALLELATDYGMPKQHYQAMASLLDRPHAKVALSGGIVNVTEAADALENLMNQVAAQQSF